MNSLDLLRENSVRRGAVWKREFDLPNFFLPMIVQRLKGSVPQERCSNGYCVFLACCRDTLSVAPPVYDGPETSAMAAVSIRAHFARISRCPIQNVLI